MSDSHGAPPGKAIVEARGLRKWYRTGAAPVEALRGVDVAIQAGEIVAIMGPSGCGKTTLLQCLSGLDDFDEGEVWIDGTAIREMRDAQKADLRARRTGFVFQAYNLLPVLDAVENVELPLLLAGRRGRDARTRALSALKAVGLEHRARHRPNELSGGQQQRVAIARALVNDPAVVWADEPTGNLDSESAVEILDLVERLNRRERSDLRTGDPRSACRRARPANAEDARRTDRGRGAADQLASASSQPDGRPGRRIPGYRSTPLRDVAMSSILGVPTTTIAAVVAAIFVGGVAILAVIGIRDRLLLRLAIRNVPRRRAQSALIALGLALSTVIITTALNTGDTMSHTMRSLVAGTVGRADEIVVRPRRDARRIGFDNVQSVANGTFLTGSLQPFDQSEANRLQDALADDERVAGVAPAVVEQVTAVNTSTGELQAQVRLYALPREYPPVFGNVGRSRAAQPIDFSALGEAAVLLNPEATNALRAEVGQRLLIQIGDRSLDVEVAA